MRDKIIKILKENDLEWAQSTVSNQELPFRIVGPTKPPPSKKNMFVVETEWMSGDADSYNSDGESYKADLEQEFEWFVDLCRVYRVLIDEGYGDWEEINTILNPIGYYVRSGKDKSGTDVTDLIRRDVFSDGEYPAQLSEINIKYYDTNGIEHDVRLKR